MLDFLSCFGNAAILLALSVLFTAWLAREAGVRATLAWGLSLALCVGVIAVLKIYFHGCPRPEFGLRSPSGHAGFSLFVYGAIGVCAARDEAGWRRLLVPPLACAWIAAIAWSRYALHAHSVSEIVFGLALGGAALWLFLRLAAPLPVGRFPFVAAIIFAALLTVLMYGTHSSLDFERWLGRLGRLWRPWLPLCSRH